MDLDLPLNPADYAPDILIRATDREVIIARDDVQTTKVSGDYTTGGLCGLPIPPIFASTPSEDGCNYSLYFSLPTPFGTTVDIKRGFVAVDAVIEGKEYRIVNTHLTARSFSLDLRSFEATELIATVQALTPSSKNLIVLGDMNGTPDEQPYTSPDFGPLIPPYLLFVNNGFIDSWSLLNKNDDGYSFGQDLDLLNQKSQILRYNANIE